MQFCRSCAEQVDDGFVRCPHCGIRMRSRTPLLVSLGAGVALAIGLLVLGLRTSANPSPEPTTIQFGTRVDSGSLALKDTSTTFPANKEFSYVATGIACREATIVTTVSKVTGEVEKHLYDIEGKWGEEFDNGALSNVLTMPDPGTYTIRVLCGPRTAATGTINITCLGTPDLFSEWFLLLKTLDCVDRKYTCENFAWRKLLDGKKLDAWPFPEARPQSAFTAGFRYMKFIEGVRNSLDCPSEDTGTAASEQSGSGLGANP